MEGLPKDTELPTDFERSELLTLTGHTLEWMEIDGELIGPSNDGDLLRAMIGLRHKYLEINMPPNSMAHLRKMMFLHSRLTGLFTSPADIALARSTQLSLVREYKDFESFSEDLSDMSPAWQLAYNDVLSLRADGEPEE